MLFGRRTIAFPLLTLACVLLALELGKDLSWDQLQHHFYLGFSALNDRFDQDFLPASVQSYFVPYAYIPFYLLASSELSDRWVVALLAAVASIGLWGVWELGGRVVGWTRNDPAAFSTWAAWLSAGLAFIAPVYFVQIGSSFVDAPIAGLVVWGYAVLLMPPWAPRAERWRVIVAALLLGVAAGLKQSNAFFAIAALPVLLIQPFQKSPWRASAVFVLAGVSSALAVSLPWFLKVQAAFQNPLFPTFNGFFKSDLFPAVNFGHHRFIPIDLSDALLRPLWMMSPEKLIYTDPPAPDARFFFLFLLLPVFLAAYLYSRKQSSAVNATRRALPLLALWAAFVFSWIVWLTISGNGRYFMPMILLASPLLVGTVVWISPNKRWLIYSLTFIFLFQGTLAYMGAFSRYTVVDWSGPWYRVSVPEELSKQPAVVLAVSMEPSAFLVPYLHPNSSYITVGSQHALSPGEPGWRRVEELWHRENRPVWLLSAVLYADADGRLARPPADELNRFGARFGLQTVQERCVDITLENDFAGNSVQNHFVACPTVPAADDVIMYLTERANASAVFDQLAVGCPLLFGEPKPVTDARVRSWWRYYMASDVMVWIDRDIVYFMRSGFYEPIRVGRAAEVLQGTARVNCDRKRQALPIASAKQSWWWGVPATLEFFRDLVVKSPGA